MYSLEHDAQPQVFSNAFSGIWWAVSTLLTVGYGDIYPITTLGKIFGILITFLGVGMVAIPTGIISAGFVDQYSRIKRISEYGTEADIHFIRIHLTPRDCWANAPLRDLGLPEGVIIAAVQRGRDIIVPRGDVVLLPGDNLVLGAGVYEDDVRIAAKGDRPSDTSSLGGPPAPGSGHFPTDGHHHGPPPKPNADPQRRPEAAGG